MITIKLRRDLYANWESKNPLLGDGEPGFEIDTGRFKIGDGVSRWMSLNYFVPAAGETSQDALAAHIASLTPHPVYDDGPSLNLLYENAKV